jgi:DNA-binding CsgD family transcriptional regulator
MTGELSTFGVGPDAERLYRTVLRSPRADLGTHAVTLGWGKEHTDAAYRALITARLLRDSADGTLVAESPRNAIGRLVDKEEARLDLRRRELDEAREAIGDFADEHLAGLTRRVERPAVDVIPPDLAVAAMEDALRTTTGPMRWLHVFAGAGPGADVSLIRQFADAIAAGRELRSIYPVGVLHERETDALRWIREWADFGERQRLTERLPHEFLVFGDDLAFAATEWGEYTSALMAVRLPMLVQAFKAVFDHEWDQGVRPPEGRDRAGDLQLLSLLAAGLKDEAIARFLGLGLRTVRRRLAALMEEYGAHTRFQLGIAAERRGLLQRP